jgi:hypothetical protein
MLNAVRYYKYIKCMNDYSSAVIESAGPAQEFEISEAITRISRI